MIMFAVVKGFDLCVFVKESEVAKVVAVDCELKFCIVVTILDCFFSGPPLIVGLHVNFCLVPSF